jgi:hypothetical protein
MEEVSRWRQETLIDIPVLICRKCSKPKIPCQLKKMHKGFIDRICKPCMSHQAQQWSKNHPAHKKATDKRYHQKHRTRLILRQKEYYKNNREKCLLTIKARHKRYPWIYQARQRKNVIDPKLYTKLLRSQNGVCAICHGHANELTLVIDHCHFTGIKRGLLCSECNKGIGFLKDDPEILRRALEYIQREFTW